MTFPSKVNLYEVGPRDGLQNEKKIIPIDVKVNLINKLINCNFKQIEIGSFVSPRWVPQMADSEVLIDKINKSDTTSFPVLTPNLKGVEKAIEKEADTVCVFLSASETFSKKNTNCTVGESLKRVEEIVAEVKLTFAKSTKAVEAVALVFVKPIVGLVKVAPPAAYVPDAPTSFDVV